MARLSFIAWLVCFFCWPGRAEATTVAILRPSNDAPSLDEARFRLQGELSSIGVAVALTDRPPFRDMASAEAAAWFEQAATERGVDAFIDVLGDGQPVGVDIWIREQSPLRLRMARVLLEPPDAENAAATLAIRAIEVLRSSFLALELADGHEPPPPVTPPPEREARAAPEHVARLALEAGATALTSLDGVGPAVLPLARLDWALRPWLSLQATLAGFGTRPRLETSAGSVQVAQEFGLLGLCVCTLSSSGIHPFVALSAGALHTALDGRAGSPNVGHHRADWAFLLEASVGARLSLPDRLYLGLASQVQLAEPYVAIHVLDAVVATTGRPNLLMTLTAGARL